LATSNIVTGIDRVVLEISKSLKHARALANLSVLASSDDKVDFPWRVRFGKKITLVAANSRAAISAAAMCPRWGGAKLPEKRSTREPGPPQFTLGHLLLENLFP